MAQRGTGRDRVCFRRRHWSLFSENSRAKGCGCQVQRELNIYNPVLFLMACLTLCLRLQGEAKLKPDNIEPIARAANVTPVRGAAIQHARETLNSRLFISFCHIMMYAVRPFDYLFRFVTL